MAKFTPFESGFFSPIDANEVVDLVGFEADPDEMVFRFSDARLGGSLLPAIEEMATDLDDDAHAARRTREEARPDLFTIGLCHADASDTVLSMATVGFEADDDTLQIAVEMLFTDAECRGEGLGYLIAAGCCLMTDRAIQGWKHLPGARGALPRTLQVNGEPVSEGGLALMTMIRDDALTRLEDLDRSRVPEFS